MSLPKSATMKPAEKLDRAVRNDVVWNCCMCGYRISDLEMCHVRFDYGCPRCETSFCEFIPKELKSEKEKS